MADFEGIFADLSTLAGTVNSAEGGLPAIQGLVEFTQTALGAAGASFAEYGTAGGRVIAASGASLWTVGRQVDAAAGGLGDAAGGRIVELPVERLPAEAGQLSGRGIRWMLATRDAHPLYAGVGFTPLGRPDQLMELVLRRPAEPDTSR